MCRCDQGICSVGITGDSIAAGSFQYTVTANSQTSNSANVSISIIERAAFVSTWRMGVAGYGNGNLRLELPISSAYDYEMTVDWGDGSPLSIVTDYFDDDRKHDYAVAGDYTVTIRGKAEAWRNSSDDSFSGKMISVTDLGDLGWIDLSDAFYYYTNLKSFKGGYTADVISMKNMFASAHKLEELDLSSFDTSNVTDMSGMFNGLSKITSLDLSNFKTSQTKNMEVMFFSMVNLVSLNISSFDTTNVEDMTLMFGSLRSLVSLDISHFKTSKVREMNSMFYDMLELTSLNISSLDTSEVTTMRSMFYGLRKLESLDISHFNTAKVNNMNDMFSNASGVRNLYTGNLDLSSNPTADDIWFGARPDINVYCTQGSGNFFGKICQ